jgi:hypothetical protein
VGQTTNQIEADIDIKRTELSGNLDALEQKVRAATDWKQHYRRNPVPILGIALGGGILLASIVSGRRNGQTTKHGRAAPEGSTASKTLATLDNIKGALVNVAATTFTTYLGKLVPGFREHFEQIRDANKPDLVRRP